MDEDEMIKEWQISNRLVVHASILEETLNKLVKYGIKDFAVSYLGGQGWGIRKMF